MDIQRSPSGIFICGDGSKHMSMIPPTTGWYQCEYWINFGESSRRCTTRMQSSEKKYCYEHMRLPQSAQHRCMYYTCGNYIDNTHTYCPQHSGNSGILDLARSAITVSDATGHSCEPETTDEGVIDWAYQAKMARSTSLRFRHYRKNYEMETVHYKIEIKGKRDDITMFHAILGEVDHDYPFRIDRPGTTVPGCSKCHGYVWNKATVTPDEVKRAAKQVGVWVKFKHYLTETKCGGEVKQVAVGGA